MNHKLVMRKQEGRRKMNCKKKEFLGDEFEELLQYA